MSHTVNCIKLGKELPAMDFPPFAGEIGTKLWNEVSQEAWNLFLEHFKMIMNEYRLQGGTEQATNSFMKEAERYFYSDVEADAPPDYKPEEATTEGPDAEGSETSDAELSQAAASWSCWDVSR